MLRKLIIVVCGVMLLAGCAYAATPVAQWLLDDGLGRTAVDEMGTYNAPLFGNVQWIPDDVPTKKCLDFSVRFGGTKDDYIALNNQGTLAPSAVTVTFWAKATGIHVGQAMLSKYWSAPGSFELGWGNNGNLYWRVWNTAGNQVMPGQSTANPFTNTMFNDGEWHFFAATADAAGGAKLYADGVLIESLSMGGLGIRITGNPLQIGRRSYPGSEAPYSGMMSTVTIFNTALSQPEIAAMMVPLAQPGTVSGRVMLSNFNTSGNEVRHLATPVVIEFVQNGSVVRTQRIDISASGDFTAPIVSPGAYDIAFVASQFLRKVVPNVVVDGPTSLAAPVVLVNGDVDGDNEITSTDLSVVLGATDQAGD